MTPDQWNGAIVVGIIIAIGLLWDRWKRGRRPQVFFVDVVEVWERAPKKPSAFPNLFGAAVFIFVLWALTR